MVPRKLFKCGFTSDQTCFSRGTYVISFFCFETARRSKPEQNRMHEAQDTFLKVGSFLTQQIVFKKKRKRQSSHDVHLRMYSCTGGTSKGKEIKTQQVLLCKLSAKAQHAVSRLIKAMRLKISKYKNSDFIEELYENCSLRTPAYTHAIHNLNSPLPCKLFMKVIGLR